MKLAALPALLVAVLVAGCGSADKIQTSAAPKSTSTTPSKSAKPATTAKVKIAKFLYEPARITVAPGTKVTFTNLDSSAHTATIAEGARAFDTGTIDKGETKSATFTKPGTYVYLCTFHPYMKGTVVVKGEPARVLRRPD